MTSVPAGRSRLPHEARSRTLVAVLALVIVVTGLPPAPAAAAGCFPAGGVRMPDVASAGGHVVFDGRGWGHGVGMSQWGAQGAAKLGCSVADILTTYYAGVDITSAAMPQQIRVGIVPDRRGGALVDAYDVRVTAGSVTWTVPATDPGTGGVTPRSVTQPAGTTWRVVVADGGAFEVRDRTDGSGGVRLSGGDGRSALVADLEGATVELPAERHTYRRGTLEFFPAAAHGGDADELIVTLEISSDGGTPAMDAYLYGLAEMPSSWEPAALQAQAIVGRSYALAQHQTYRGDRPGCRCDLYDSTASQNYTAWDKEGEARFGARWVDAVRQTRGRVMTSGGRVAVGFYASSHGGHSETNAFVWGGRQLDYSRAVDDSRWDRASGNPNAAWSVGFDVDDLSDRLADAGHDVGRVQALTLPGPRGQSGRVGDPDRGAGGVLIKGSAGTVRISGNALRTALGLRSTLVTVRTALECVPPVEVDSADLRPVRHAGADRVATAVALSAAHWPDGADTAIIASAEDFPDALAGGPLAADRRAPLLLTPADRLDPRVGQELLRLGVDSVTVIGGTAALGSRVTEELADLLAGGSAAVTRIAGENRWATAADVARAVDVPGDRRAVLALGSHPEPARAWPDAVASSALQAGGTAVPLLLTASTGLPPATRAALRDLGDGGLDRVDIVGGAGAVPETVAGAVTALGLEVGRLAGPDRFATSAAVADAALERGADPARLLVARADAYPDALSAAAVAARTGAPLLLVDRCDVARRSATSAWLDRRPPMRRIDLVGGAAALSERVRWQLDQQLVASP